MKRKIIQIDEAKCNGCGRCVNICAEAALEIVDGKAKVVREFFCDGLGACLDICPVGALKIAEKDSVPYDAQRTLEHVKKVRGEEALKNVHGCENCAEEIIINTKSKHHGCPGSASQDLSGGGCCKSGGGCSGGACGSSADSELSQWPIQLHLISPDAPFFQDADIVISADCAPFAYAKFHDRFLKGRKAIIFCPKLDSNQDLYVEKLTELFKTKNIRSVTLVRMEVPCCSGVERIVVEALENFGVNVLIKEFVLSLKGEII